ncbi:MAG TPA: DUF4232 domain-containing protein [Gaiellaceae bacterium]
MKAFIFGGALALVAAGCGGTKTITETTTVTHTVTVHETTTVATTTGGANAANACTGDAMSGTFNAVPGSAGAGTIVYRLRVTNTSPVACYVSGLPDVQLRGSNGADLPTDVVPVQQGLDTSARLTLQPNASASADARFSPDVNGTGDSTTGQCQPKSVTMRVGFGGAPLDVDLSPPTPVCERGQLQFKLFSAS